MGHLLISGVHEIAAVSKVIVHYTDTSHVNVDAFVKLSGDLSVSEARAVALKGKNAIVEDGRYAADIYLDLST